MNMNAFRYCAVTLHLAVSVPGLAADAPTPEKTVKQSFAELLPALSAEKPQARQQAEQQWQEICFKLSAPGNEAARNEASRLMSEKLDRATPAVTRIWLLTQLMRIGHAECVDAVSAALDDQDPLVRDAARRALTKIPGPEAAAKLQAKLKSAADAKFKIGLINALGQRAETGSVEAIARELASTDSAVAVAAAKALGKIGTIEAAAALAKAKEKAMGELRFWVDDALLLRADRLAAVKQDAAALAIYKDLNKPEEPRSIRMAAVQGILRRPETSQDGDSNKAAAILYVLAGNDADAKAVVVGYVGKADEPTLFRVTEKLGELPPAGQIALIDALGEARCKSARTIVLRVAKSPDENVRLAVIRALGGVGSDHDVPLLLTTLRAGGALGDAARTSLETLRAGNVDLTLVELMKDAQDVGQRGVLIEILDKRRAVAAVPALVEETASRESRIRRLAFSALGRLASAKEVAAMIRATLALTDRGERDDAERAITLVCLRVPDEAQRAEPVLAVFDAAGDQDKNALLSIVGRIGCPKTLDLIRAALASDDPQRCEGGFSALCNWPDITGAEDLLKLFAAAWDKQHRLRAVRAFGHSIGDPHEGSVGEKVKMLKQALEAAGTDEERQAILQFAGNVRCIETLRLVLPMVDSPKLSLHACRAIVELAHHDEIRRPNRAEFLKALDRVIEVSKDRGLVDQAKFYQERK